jgi:hypothetical protein
MHLLKFLFKYFISKLDMPFTEIITRSKIGSVLHKVCYLDDKSQ